MRFFILNFNLDGEDYVLVFMSDVTLEKYENELKEGVSSIVRTYTGDLDNSHSLEVQIVDYFHKNNYKCSFLQNVEMVDC